MKKIFAVLDSKDVYGKELSNIEVCKTLEEHGYDITILYNKDASERLKQFTYVDIIGYQLFVVNTVEKWMCFLLAYGRKPRFNVFNLILQEKCEFEVAK